MLVIILGNLGSGKTLIMTLLTYFNNKQIWSNYFIDSVNYRELEVVDLFNLPDNINLLMDEGYSWLESRASQDYLNAYLSSILYHSRKTFTDIYITTPDFSTIDKRFRKLVNFIILCEHRENFEVDDFHFVFYDKENKSYSDITLLYSDAKQYFKMYNTLEKVESTRKNRLEFGLLKRYPIRLRDYIIELTEMIKSELNGKITHDLVKDKLLMNGIDLAYEKYIYIRLKGNKNANND